MLKNRVYKMISGFMAMSVLFSASFLINPVPKSEAFIGVVLGHAIGGAVRGNQLYQKALEIEQNPSVQHNLLLKDQMASGVSVSMRDGSC